MNRAGLHKVTKTVKGGKRRAYWVKSEVPVVRAAGRVLANKHVQTGLKVAALVGGTALAAHLGKKHMGKLGGVAMGLHEGLKTLKERGDSGAIAHLKGHLSRGLEEGRKADASPFSARARLKELFPSHKATTPASVAAPAVSTPAPAPAPKKSATAPRAKATPKPKAAPKKKKAR